MSNIVYVFITRHAQSTWNYYHSNHNPNIDKNIFTNSALTSHGIEDIINKRDRKLLTLANTDFIFTSPLKRSIETCLLTYNKAILNRNIYILSLLTELDTSCDNDGIFIEDILRDPDIVTCTNFSKLDTEYLFLANPNTENGEWWNIEFRQNVQKRISDLFIFLSDSKFTGKNVSLFSHNGFIANIIGNYVDNYQTVSFILNQEDRTIYDINFS